MSENEENAEVQNLCLRLQELLLANKTEKNAEWLAEVNPLIAKLASFFSQKTSSLETAISEKEAISCLEAIACITHAANLGIKEAKKRLLNVKYWDKYPCPSIIKNIASKPIQIAAYKRLSVLSNEALKNYLRSEIAMTEDVDINAHQFEWMLGMVKQPSILIETIAQLSIENNLPNLYLNCLLFLNEQIKKQNISISNSLCKALSGHAKLDIKNDKLVSANIDLLDSIFSARPDFLLSVDFIIYLSIIKEINSSNKKINKLANSICTKFFDLTESLSNIDPEILKNDYIKDLAAAHSNHVEDILNLKKINPEKYDFNQTETKDIAPNNSTLEINVIELAASWDDYVKIDPPSEHRNYLEKKIENVLSSAKIDQYSRAGEVILFDPTKQENISQPTELTSKVKVIKPGYTQIRLNGSTKVLRKAIVESLND